MKTKLFPTKLNMCILSFQVLASAKNQYTISGTFLAIFCILYLLQRNKSETKQTQANVSKFLQYKNIRDLWNKLIAEENNNQRQGLACRPNNNLKLQNYVYCAYVCVSKTAKLDYYYYFRI